MNFDKYQSMSMRTRDSSLDGERELILGQMGLSGESGEVVELIKKHIFHGHTLDINLLIKEIGDVLWYIALICEATGVSMSEVAEANIEKLKRRYPDGFSREASVNREE